VAENLIGISYVRTTPHLVGWLVYERQLTDGDIPAIISDNKAFRNRLVPNTVRPFYATL
jgi:hypothetical protein